MDPVHRKILDLASETQIRQFSQFADSYSSQTALLAKRFHENANPRTFIKTTIGYGEVALLDLLYGLKSPDVSKTLMVFYHLLDESESLLREAAEAQEKFLIIDLEISEEDNTNLDVQMGMLSEHFQFLCGASRLILRLIENMRCIVEQSIRLLVTFPKAPISLQVVIEDWLRVMKQIETFDEIISSSKLKFLWMVFKGKVFNHFQMIENEYGQGSAKGVSTFLEELDQFFAGNFFAIFLTEINSTKGVADKDSLYLLGQEVLNVIKSLLKETSKYKLEISDFQEADNLIYTSLLVVFSYNFFGNINNGSSVFKQWITLTSKHCAVSILPNVLWRPEVFIATYANQLIGKQWTSYSKNMLNQRKLLLQGKLATLQSTVNSLSFQTIMIIVELHTTFGGSRKLKTIEDLQNALAILRRHLSLAGILACTIKTVINLHVALEMDLTRNCMISIGKLVELLISMRWAIEGNSKGILFNLQTAQELYQFKLLTIIDALRKKLIKSGLKDPKKLNTYSVLEVGERCVNGALTRNRLMVLGLISTEEIQQIFASEGNASLIEIIKNLQQCLNPTAEWEVVMDTSFLFCNKSILKVYLKNYLLQLEDPARLVNFLSAMSTRKDHPRAQRMLKLFKETLQSELVHKLSREIENKLRLDYHKKLNTNAEINLNTLMLRDPSAIINLKPFQVFNEYFELKGLIEADLSQTFYNLITVSPHDWKTYGEMRQAAEFCYGLSTVPDGLPLRTVDQACDIMDILKDMPVFVHRFCYDMNGQVFVEKESNNKHLNSIHVSHVARSIQTHGIGIINTTVNVTYQFLKKKIHVFSQLLFDEHVKSRLIRDHRIVADRIMSKAVIVYPIEAGANLIKHIRSVFAASNREISYMDGFRDLLIEIGNALGFVRSMRSGRLEMGANALEHFIRSQGETNYEKAFPAETNSEETTEAAKGLDAAIHSLEENFSASADYLKMLVNAFNKHIRNEKFSHLQKFYLLVPALTMNFVEHMIILKEDLSREHSRSHQYMDDGFTLGMVYLLTVLDQIGAFNSLHWFTTVDKYYKDEIQKLAARPTETGVDQEKIMQTRSLSERRFRSLQREFNLLYFNLSSSKIFFQ